MTTVTSPPDRESERTAAQGATGGLSRDLDAVFGDLTHAVANSLNSIAAASELAELLIARGEVAGASRSLGRIESECMRAARLLRDGRKFMTFRISPERDAIDVAALVRACAGSFEGLVKVDAGRSISSVCGDADALRRMFAELLGNAFEAGASQVHVRLKHETSGHGVRIDFRDDGPGVTAPVERLFAPFFSTRAADHSGLGLALAARIATAHAGAIGADASADGGAFWITLPMHAG